MKRGPRWGDIPHGAIRQFLIAGAPPPQSLRLLTERAILNARRFNRAPPGQPDARSSGSDVHTCGLHRRPWDGEPFVNPTSTPTTPPTPVPAPIPSGNSGAAADAAADDKQRITDYKQILTDLNNNQDPVSDMVAYQAICLKELGDLHQENENLLASLQGNSSLANWTTVSNKIQTNLQKMRMIMDRESAVQQLAAIKANNNGNGFNAIPPAPVLASVPPGTVPPGGLNVDNTWDWGNPPGSTPIPVSDVQYDANNNDQTTLPFPFPNELAFFVSASQALDALGITDPTARQNWLNGYLVAANRESSYNTDAVNTTDYNAVGPSQSDGAPAGSSRGLMQVTPTTFAQYHQTGTSDNIYDPVANIAASMNYVMKHYGVNQDGSNLGTVSQFNPNDSPHGYFVVE